LSNIKVNGWANSEIVHIIREQNPEIAWLLHPEGVTYNG
jgi:hypothetical protein